MHDANTPSDPIIALLLAHSDRRIRPGWDWLWRLEKRINDGVDRAGEPILAQMRIAWWRDRLNDPQNLPAQRDPMLHEVAILCLTSPDLLSHAIALLDHIEARVTAENGGAFRAGIGDAGATLAQFYAIEAGLEVAEAGSVGRAFALARHIRSNGASIGQMDLNEPIADGQAALSHCQSAPLPRPISLMRLYAAQILNRPDTPPRRRDGLRLVFHGLTGL